MNTTFFPAAKVIDLQNNEMKQIKVDGTDILLVKTDDQFYAMGAFCTHYGAPLAKGALCGKHVICPWHHAWFDITNGNLIEPPALDALPHYAVKIEGENVLVSLPSERADRRLPSMVTCNTEADNRVFAILGGGAAGYAATQTLREDGFQGRIVMITAESELPYDRPNLSKEYLQGEAQPEWMPLRPDDFYKTHRVEVMRNMVAKQVDHQHKKILFEDGEPLFYDALLVATGGVPRKPDLPGTGLANIFILRSFDSADRIISALEDAKKVVIVGASFIGMEGAASLRSRGLSVTVVAPDKVPFAKTLGPEIGEFFRNLHEQKGVHFKLGVNVKAFDGNSTVEAVLLDSGERLEADVVIVGIGVRPATDILAGISKQKDGGVMTDEYLRLDRNLYAAGDIAYVPDPHTKEPVRIEHWRYALQQGRTAAHNMAGKETPFTAVPFFWTAHFGVSLRYLGHAKGWDEIIYDGNVNEGKFLAFYCKDDRITAVAGIGRDTEMAHLEQLMKDDAMPSANRLKKEGFEKTFSKQLD